MKFLVDAQLPRLLAFRLREAGNDAVHTLDLSAGNRTTDVEILAIAYREGRVIITKDADFVTSFILTQHITCSRNVASTPAEIHVDARF